MNQPAPHLVAGPISSTRERCGLGLVSFFHFAVLGSWLPILPLYCQETLGFRWQQTGLVCACVSLGLLFAPLVHSLCKKLLIDARIGLAAGHLLGAGISMGVGWSRQRAEFQSVDLWHAVAVVAVFSLVISPTFRWMHELSIDSSSRETSRGWRLWGAVGFVLPAWLTEFGIGGLDMFRETVASRDVLWLIAGWSGVLVALATFIIPRISRTDNDIQSAPAQSQRIGAGLSIAFLLILFAHRAQALWMPVFFDRVLFLHQVTTPFEHRLLVVSQVFEMLALYMLVLSLTIIRIRLTMCLGAICWVARGLLMLWMNQSPMPGREALTYLFIGQVLAGTGLVLFFGALGAIVSSNSRTGVLTGLAAVSSLVTVLVAGVCAHRILDPSTVPFAAVERLVETFELDGIEWRLRGWNLLWLATSFAGVLAIPLILVARTPPIINQLDDP
jgi:hypothetical protein